MMDILDISVKPMCINCGRLRVTARDEWYCEWCKEGEE